MARGYLQRASGKPRSAELRLQPRRFGTRRHDSQRFATATAPNGSTPPAPGPWPSAIRPIGPCILAAGTESDPDAEADDAADAPAHLHGPEALFGAGRAS